MDKLYEKIQSMKQRPGLYIRNKNLHLLKAYLDGYIHCYMEIHNEENYFFLPKFQEYIQCKYQINSPTPLDWVEIITMNEKNDECAFDRFYELLDEFFAESKQ